MAERGSVAAGIKRRAGCKRQRSRVYITGQAPVLHCPNHIKLRPQSVERAFQADLGIFHLDAGLSQIGPVLQGLGDQGVDGPHRFSFWNRDGVCRNDVRRSNGGIRQAAASERRLDDQLLLLNQTLAPR